MTIVIPTSILPAVAKTRLSFDPSHDFCLDNITDGTQEEHTKGSPLKKPEAKVYQPYPVL